MIRDCRPADAPAIAAIYNHYIHATVISFEEAPVAASEMSRRIQDVTTYLPWLVWDEADAVLGYAYATPWKSRSAYRYSVESAVYVRSGATGRGIGKALYGELLARLEHLGMHTVVAGISLPNPASIALHEQLGFAKVAEFPEIGRKHDQWVNVGYWQKRLNNEAEDTDPCNGLN